MSIEFSTLANGIRVVSHNMPHLETVSLGVWVAAGARHETASENGISHLLEHMAFKGTKRRTARAIAEEIEAVGGELNAATSVETTAYYARVLKGDEGVALDILADILLEPSYADDDLVKEREVILQEIAGINDSPDELAYDLIHDAAYPGQPLGRPIIGTPETVTSITAEQLRKVLTERYAAPRTVISAAGAIDHERLVRLAGALFGGMSGTAGDEGMPAAYGGGRRALDKTFEQSHLLLAFESPSYRDKDFYTTQVLSGLLGGGMSSRLFQEVRENRGLCYAIYSSAWGLADTGLFMVHAATGAEMMPQLIEVVGRELKATVDQPPTEAEVHRAKAQIKAGLLMGLESSSARAEQMARQILIANRLITTEELIQRIDVVTPTDIQRVASRIVAKAPPSIAVVGAGKRSERHAAAAEKSVAV